MLILGHKLQAPELEATWDEDQTLGAPITPRLIVIHYAVTDSLEATARALKASDYVSAHLSIDGYAEGPVSRMRLRQHVPFNQRAGHAGPTATYKGIVGVNGISIGIEVANPGPLLEVDGELFTTYGVKWTKGAIKAKHQRNKAPKNWTHWATYTNEEYGMLAVICRCLIDHYPSITDIVGHDEIRQDKYDPGPAFNMQWLRDAVGVSSSSTTVA